MSRKRCVRRLFITEALESRRLLTAIAWDGGGDGLNWSDAQNWSLNRLPTRADDVTIHLAPDSPQVVFNQTVTEVESLTVQSDMLLTSFLKVRSKITVQNATLTIGGVPVNQNPTGTILFIGDGLITGNGNIELSGYQGGILIDTFMAPSRKLTIDSGITIRMTGGTDMSVGTGPVTWDGVLINHGHIEAGANGARLRVGGNGNTFTNDGTLSVSNNAILDVTGLWNSSTPIDAGDGTVWLRGAYSSSVVSSIIRTGSGVTNLDGTVDLAAAPLTITDSTGTVVLNANGTLVGGGTISTLGNARLSCRGGSLWGNYTINGTIELLQNATGIAGGITLNGTLIGSGGELKPFDGWTLDVLARDGARILNGVIKGTITVSDSAATLWVEKQVAYADIRLQGVGSKIVAVGSQSWINTTLQFASSGATSLILRNTDAQTPATLTNWYGTFRGGRGQIVDDPSNQLPSHFLNKGTISADVAGTEIVLHPGSWTNEGTAQANGQGVLNIVTVPTNLDPSQQSLTNGTWSAGAGSTLLLPSAVTSNAATVSLGGAGASIPALASLRANAGTISLAPGANLTLAGAFAQSSTATLKLSLSGTAPGVGFGTLSIAGPSSLAGTLDIQLLAGFSPDSNASFPFLSAGSVAGAFTVVTPAGPTALRRYVVRYGSSSATLGIAPLAPTAVAMLPADDLGISNSDRITSSTQPRWTGTATEGTSARLYVDGAFVASSTISAGKFTLMPPVLAAGTHSVEVAVVDADGDESVRTAPQTMLLDTVAPQGTSVQFVYSGGHPVQGFTISFSESVAASLSNYDLVVNNVTTAECFSSMNIVLDGYDANVATFSLYGFPGAVLPDGNYELLVPLGTVTDVAGNYLASDITLSFFVFSGDANHDRKIDADDLSILSANWQGSSKTFSQGDFNYDGRVDIHDLYILASKWQQTLPPPVVPAVPAATTPGRRTPVRVATSVLS